MRAKLTSLLMVLCLLMVFAAVVQAAPAGKVTNLEGRADLTAPGQPAKVLFIGDAVNVGDILRTKSASKLEVTWIDGSIARLSENSRLKVTEFSMGAKKRSTILSLFRGKVQNIVTGTTKLFGAKGGSKYEVHTPTSVCGVRGTIFFAYHENGVSGVLFTQGQGFMYSKGQPDNVKPVAPGVLMTVTSANKPPEAKPAKPGDATKLFNATNPSEKKKDDKKDEDKKEGGTATSGGGTTAASGKDESTGGTKTEDTGSTTTTTTTTTTTETTGTTDTMLGGDPTATLGTAPPGTLASQIETGTTADTPGTSSPLTNPTTPVAPVVVPVIEPTPTFPSVSMETSTVSPTKSETATFVLSSTSTATPVTFEYKFNNVGWQAITGTTLTLTAPDLPEGSNSIIFRAKDSMGNLTTEDSYAQKQWTVYYTNPDVSWVTTPPQETTSLNSPFSVQANRPDGHVNYSYTLDGENWINAEPLFAVTNGLKKDENNISLKATDIAGNSSTIDYSWYLTGLDLLQPFTLGGLSGTLATTPITLTEGEGTGTIELTASGTAGVSSTPISGSLTDGTIFNGYLAGIQGSWRGLFNTIYKKNSTIGLFRSDDLNNLSYSGGILNASGILKQKEMATTSDSEPQLFPLLPLLVLQNLAIGESFSDPIIRGPYQESGIATEGIKGYNTSSGAGGILGIWGAETTAGTYVNATGVKSENVYLYHYSYVPDPYAFPIDHFAFGSVTVTDDLAGHTTVSGTDSLTYLDRQYLGKLSLDYRGVYDYSPETSPSARVGYSYSSVGTGIYNLQALSWSGDWGPNRNYAYHLPLSLYGNFYDEEYQESFMELVAHETGLVGGVAPFWAGTSRLTALGYIVNDGGIPVAGEIVAGPFLWNSGIAAQATTGVAGEEEFVPDAEFTGVTAGVWKDGLMNGSAYAIYKTAAGQAGWLIGKDKLSGLYNSDLGVWKIEGDITPTPKFASLHPELTANLEIFHDIAFGITGGSFGGQGSILNQFSILQTTFYGTRISVYDEEYEQEVERILPLRWGIYDVMAGSGNSFTGKTDVAPSWTAKVGGVGPTQMGAPFYYLADITGTWAADETISGELTGTYMTPLYKGVLSGPFYGLYNIGGTDETGQYGGWVGQSVGTYNITQKLEHSGTWGENLYVWYDGEGGLFTDAGGSLDHAGNIMGLLGGTTPPWSGSSALKAMGLFQLMVENDSGRGTYLWSGAIGGSVPREIAEPIFHGGIYTGYSAALWRANNYAGAIRAIYLTPPDADGKSSAGFLAGDSLTGSVYTLAQQTEVVDVENVINFSAGLWESTGANTLTASLPLASSLDPVNVTLAGGFMDARLFGTFGGPGTLTNNSSSGSFTFFMNGAEPLPFGVYDLKLGSGETGGTFSGKQMATSWDAKLGGNMNIGGGPALAVYGGYNYEYGYWLADAAGQWNAAGEMTGNVTNGKYLTTTQMGTLSGPFYGLYTEGETAAAGTWVGQSIGSFEVTKALAFSSVFSGSTFQTAKGTLNINTYVAPGVNSNMGIFQGADYETAYFRADGDTSGSLVKYGWQWENVRNRYTHQRTDLIYYPNDSYQRLRVINGVPQEDQYSTSAHTSVWGFWPDFHQSPPASPIGQNIGFTIVNDAFPFTGPLVVDPANMEFAKIFSQQVPNWYSTVRLIPDPEKPLAFTFEGIMGGYAKDGDAGRTLWTSTFEKPMGISFMGEHADFVAPATMTAGIGSSYNDTFTTPDGGAYLGFLTNNVSADRTIRGMYYGFYISPEGEAGFLKSTNIAGTSYDNLNLWEADGDMYREKLGTISLPASDLMANIQIGAMSGNILYGGAGGNFVSGGYLKHWAMGNGYTASIQGHSSNGIFIKASSAGEYSNPEGSTTWQSDFAGYGTFGNFDAFSDYGIWHTNAGGADASWANNQIYSPVTGEFLTYTKKGTLSGTFLGNYSGTESGKWEGTASGVYQKTADVAFSSGMAGKVYANKLTKSISGSNNGTQYWIDGDPANFPHESMYAQKTSCMEGVCTATQYADYGYVDEANPVTYTKTTWQYNETEYPITSQTLLESASISYENYLAEVNAMRSGATEYTGWSLNNKNFLGVFAGFNNVSDNNNLWYNMANGQPTSIELAGLYQNGASETPGVMTTGLASFNPAVSMNPIYDPITGLGNSTSPISGAYYAYTGAAFGKTTVAADTLDGLISGLYLNPEGKVGILYGRFTGDNLPDVGYFHGTGAINGGYQLGDAYNGLSAQNFVSNVIQSSEQWNYGPNGVTATGDDVRMLTQQVSSANINNNYLSPGSGIWSIWQSVVGGTFSATPTAWQWEYYADAWHGVQKFYQAVQTTGTDNGITNGNTVGAWVNLPSTEPYGAPWSPDTGVTAGKIKGLFDPTTATFQAVAQGASMDTNTFLAKAAAMSGDAAAQEAFMNATKIPAILVGQATLTQGDGSVNNLSNVTMSNVGFYAYSTGVAPKIWATNNVSGNYSAAPILNGPAVQLSGNGLIANFNVNHWDVNNNNWAASVAGSGDHLSGGSYTGPVQFQGGAAGKIDQPSAGTFTGTGAGIAK